MKEKTIIFIKDGVEIKMPFCWCKECDIECVNKGSAGCSHSEEFTYTYQCPKCKNVEMFDGVFERESRETLERNGWKELIR